jgi:hypothetical protein
MAAAATSGATVTKVIPGRCVRDGCYGDGGDGDARMAVAMRGCRVSFLQARQRGEGEDRRAGDGGERERGRRQAKWVAGLGFGEGGRRCGIGEADAC